MAAKRKRLRPLTEKQRAIVESNRGLIGIAVKGKNYRNLTRDDQDQCGAMALIKAVKKFEKSKGFKFSTYATSAIKNELWRCEGDDTLIRIPAYLKCKGGRQHYLWPVAEAALSHANIDAVMEAGWEPAAPEEDESEFNHHAMRAVRWAVHKLPPIERNLIRRVVIRGETMKSFGESHGISKYVTTKLKLQAFARLRATLAKHV